MSEKRHQQLLRPGQIMKALVELPAGITIIGAPIRLTVSEPVAQFAWHQEYPVLWLDTEFRRYLTVPEHARKTTIVACVSTPPEILDYTREGLHAGARLVVLDSLNSVTGSRDPSTDPIAFREKMLGDMDDMLKRHRAVGAVLMHLRDTTFRGDPVDGNITVTDLAGWMARDRRVLG